MAAFFRAAGRWGKASDGAGQHLGSSPSPFGGSFNPLRREACWNADNSVYKRRNGPVTNGIHAYLKPPVEPLVHVGDSEQSQALDSMARLTISLPRSLYRQIRLHALEQDTTLSALMARLIREELNGQ
jgi:hypothetical protein